MCEPSVALWPLWPCVSHQWLQWYLYDHAWVTGGTNGIPVNMFEPPVAPMVPLKTCVSHWWLQCYTCNHAWATGGSKGGQRYRLAAFYETHIFILLYRKFCVSITKPNRLMLFKNDMQHIKTVSEQNIHTVYGIASDICFHHGAINSSDTGAVLTCLHNIFGVSCIRRLEELQTSQECDIITGLAIDCSIPDFNQDLVLTRT